MFTGIVEEIGEVINLQMGGKSGTISIRARMVMEGTALGDSIAVNGVCLTVTRILPQGFEADVMAETMRRSNLSGLKAGDKVNLERAMAANGRFGGHMVSGHIDGTGSILSRQQEENAIWITIGAAPEIMELIVEKGSIGIDGISLTVARVEENAFAVSIIPHTGAKTTLLERGIGDRVNLENDVVGKYVRKLLGLEERPQKHKKESTLTLEMLEEFGF